jgi:hypothetical protein
MMIMMAIIMMIMMSGHDHDSMIMVADSVAVRRNKCQYHMAYHH